MPGYINNKLITVLIGLFLLVTLIHCTQASDSESEREKGKRSFFGLFGPPPLPGDITSPVVCERYCRNRCLQGGFSGYLGVPGCNQFCDCSYYLGGPVFFG